MEILLSCLLLIAGFVALIKGADWFVEGSSGLAANFKVPSVIIGLTTQITFACRLRLTGIFTFILHKNGDKFTEMWYDNKRKEV